MGGNGWWPYAAEFPSWYVWRSPGGRLYARKLVTSPPAVADAADIEGLRAAIKQLIAERGLAP